MLSFQGEGKTNGGREEDMGERGRKGLRGCGEGGERGGKEGGRSLTRRLKAHIGNEDDVCGQL